MTDLGPGVRVYIKYTDACQSFNYSASTGTIVDGPYGNWDSMWLNGQRGFNPSHPPTWKVQIDNGPEAAAWEPLLVPIDDWDESVESEKEIEETA